MAKRKRAQTYGEQWTSPQALLQRRRAAEGLCARCGRRHEKCVGEED